MNRTWQHCTTSDMGCVDSDDGLRDLCFAYR
jgi:hypothetical protein